MSGHSKWATTKYRKGAQDKARAKVFAKCIRLVEVAARDGGGDLDSNATLRTAYQKARAASVPLDTIEKAIKRGTGDLEGVRYESINYEGYGPGGVAIMVETLSDNRNRTGAEMRNLFSRNGGNMAEPGAVGWQFERKGIVTVGLDNDEDKVMEIAMEGGAEDLSSNGAAWVVTSRAGRPRVGAVGAGRCRHHARVRRPVPGADDAGARPRRVGGQEGPAPAGGDRRPRRRPGGALQRGHRRRGAGRLRGLAAPRLARARSAPAGLVRTGPTPGQRARLTYERMFVLGIDPGLSRCGYGLVSRAEAGGALRAHAAGVVETDPALALADRLLILHTELSALLERAAARGGRRRARLLPGQREDRHVGGPGERPGAGRRGGGGVRDRPVHLQRGQAGPGGVRGGDQGAGAADGGPGARACRLSRGRPTSPMPWRWPSAT